MRLRTGLASGFLAVVLTATSCSSATPARDVAGSDAGRDAIGVGRDTVASIDAGDGAFASLPLTFVANEGQFDPAVRFQAHGSHDGIFVTDRGVVFSLVERIEASDGVDEPRVHGVSLALRFIGGSPQPELAANDVAPGTLNYFLGNDPESWVTGGRGYREISYRNVWRGINAKIRAHDGTLKYAFVVRPGADPDAIRLAYDGAMGLELDPAGELRIGTPLGALQDAAPTAFQRIDGERVAVPTRYVLGPDRDRHDYGFAVDGGYRADRPLIIDPSLDYSTFLGGSAHDVGNGIAVDGSGNAYVVGTTVSNDFPTTLGAFDRTLAAAPDVFVTKLNAAGSALVYSTYLGGTPAPVPAGGSDPFEFGRDIAVDGAGNAYVTGQTTSANFPTTARAFDRTLNVGTFDATDAFVTKLSPDGSRLVYSTFLGGTSLDDSLAIVVDTSGNAHIAGQTTSSNLPTTAGAFDRNPNGGQDAFVTKFDAAGSNLVYSTYLGGADNELPGGISVDAAGRVHVGGATRSDDFPTTPGAFDMTANGGFDAFVTRLNAAGSGLASSTLIGGSDVDLGDGSTIDANGNVYLSGGTLSADFPTTVGAFDRTLAGGSDGFVTKVNASGSALVFSTLLGGGGGEGAVEISLDGATRPWVTGGTSSANFPTTADAFDRTLSGPSEVFVTRLNATGSRVTRSTLLGGSRAENGRDLKFRGGDVFVTGETFSTDFPTTAGAFDRTFGGDPSIFWGDGFVARITP